MNKNINSAFCFTSRGIAVAFVASLFTSFSSYAANITETEPNDTYSTADIISVDDIVNGAIGTSDEKDYYTITVAKTGKLKLKPQAITAGVDYSLRLCMYAPDGTTLMIEDSASAAGADSISYAVEPGAYYVCVKNMTGARNYKFTAVFQPEEDVAVDVEPNDAAASASTILPSQYVTGRIGYWRSALNAVDEKDYYKITVPNTGKLKLRPVMITVGVDYSLRFCVYSADGIIPVTESTAAASGVDSISCSIDLGTYYVCVKNMTGAKNYKFTAVFQPEEDVAVDVEPNDAAASASTILPSLYVTGRIGYWRPWLNAADEKDYYKITVPNTGKLKVRPIMITVGVDYSLRFCVYSTDGIIPVTESTAAASGVDSISCSIDPGTYYVCVKNMTGAKNYKFTTICSPEEDVAVDVEPNDAAVSASTIVLNQIVTGRIGYWRPWLNAADEKDYYKITVANAGKLKLKPQMITVGVDYSLRLCIFAAGGITVMAEGSASAAGADSISCSVDPGAYYVCVKNMTGAKNYKFICLRSDLTSIQPAPRFKQNPSGSTSAAVKGLRFHYTLSAPSHVSLSLFSCNGVLIQKTDLGLRNAGSNTTFISDNRVPDGIYVAVLKNGASGNELARKVYSKVR